MNSRIQFVCRSFERKCLRQLEYMVAGYASQRHGITTIILLTAALNKIWFDRLVDLVCIVGCRLNSKLWGSRAMPPNCIYCRTYATSLTSLFPLFFFIIRFSKHTKGVHKIFITKVRLDQVPRVAVILRGV